MRNENVTKNMEKDIVSDIFFIKEDEYQKIKKVLHKKEDYFKNNEFEILMQFLMQRERESIKKQVKWNKI